MNFDDLQFNPHLGGVGTQAKVNFDNGYGASVVSGPWFYTDASNPYEVGVFHNGKLCYDTHITSDVIGHCDVDEVNRILADIEALPESDKD